MTPTQREAALRYAGILEREARDHGSTDYKYSVAALLRELLAEPQGEPVQEPVAEVVDCSEVDIDGNSLALRELDWCTYLLVRA